jgi:hypothetical protein
MRRKRKPDLLLVLTLVAGIGVVVSTRADGPREPVVHPAATLSGQAY